MPFVDVAFAAGFGSLRQFNDTVQSVFAMTPTEIRRRNRARSASSPGTIELRLAHREQLDGPALLEFLGVRAVPGVEEVDGDTYRRSLVLPFGTGIVELTPRPGTVLCNLRLDDMRDLTAAVARCRRLLDLDADPAAIADMLGGEEILRPLVRARPGLRVPGCVDGGELAIRTVLEQRLSTRGARALANRLVEDFGARLPEPAGGITHHFPTPTALAAANPDGLPGTRLRRDALHTLAHKLADGTLLLDAGADSRDVLHQVGEIRGIGVGRPRTSACAVSATQTSSSQPTGASNEPSSNSASRATPTQPPGSRRTGDPGARTRPFTSGRACPRPGADTRVCREELRALAGLSRKSLQGAYRCQR